MSEMVLEFDYYYSGGYHTTYTVTGMVTKDEEYRSNPMDNFSAFWTDTDGSDISTWYGNLKLYNRYTQGQRLACYIREDSVGPNTSYTFVTFDSNVMEFTGQFTNEHGTTSTRTYSTLPIEYWSDPDSMACPIVCHLPLFDSQTHANDYVNAATDEQALALLEEYCLNYGEETREEQFYEF